MFADNCYTQVRDRICSFPRGQMLTIAHFLDCGSYDAVRKAVSRLSQDGFIDRILMGVYWVKPFDGAIPKTSDVAAALALSNGWAIAPGPELARYELGLAESPPQIECYLSTGPSGTHHFANKTFRFRNVAHALILCMTPKASLVTSAFLDLKNYPATASSLMHLAETLTPEEKMQLMDARIYAPAKLRCLFEIICGCYGVAGR